MTLSNISSLILVFNIYVQHIIEARYFWPLIPNQCKVCEPKPVTGFFSSFFTPQKQQNIENIDIINIFQTVCDYVEYSGELFHCKKDHMNTFKTEPPTFTLFELKHGQQHGPLTANDITDLVFAKADVTYKSKQFEIHEIFIAPIDETKKPIIIVVSDSFYTDLVMVETSFSGHHTFYEHFAQDTFMLPHVIKYYFNHKYIFQRIQIKRQSDPDVIRLINNYQRTPYDGLLVFHKNIILQYYKPNHLLIHIRNMELSGKLIIKKIDDWQYMGHANNDYYKYTSDFTTIPDVHSTLKFPKATIQPLQPLSILFDSEYNTAVTDPDSYRLQWVLSSEEIPRKWRYLGHSTAVEDGLHQYHLNDNPCVRLYIFGIDHGNPELNELDNALDETDPDVIILEYDYYRFFYDFEAVRYDIKHKNVNEDDHEIYRRIIDNNEFTRVWEKFKQDPLKEIIFADIPFPYDAQIEFFVSNNNLHPPWAVHLNARNHLIAATVNKFHRYYSLKKIPNKPIKYFLLVGANHIGLTTNMGYPERYDHKFGLHDLFTSAWDKIEIPVTKLKEYHLSFSQYPLPKPHLRRKSISHLVTSPLASKQQRARSGSHGTISVETVPHQRSPSGSLNEARMNELLEGMMDDIPPIALLHSDLSEMSFSEEVHAAVYQQDGDIGYEQDGNIGYKQVDDIGLFGYEQDDDIAYSQRSYGYDNIIYILFVVIMSCVVSCFMYFCGIATVCIVSTLRWKFEKYHENNCNNNTDIDNQL